MSDSVYHERKPHSVAIKLGLTVCSGLSILILWERKPHSVAIKLGLTVCSGLSILILWENKVYLFIQVILMEEK